MSEYMIGGTLLSNIAQGIRSVDGTAAKLTPAQMQAKLTTIKTSVDGALNQVKKKGVTVPSGSDVHDLADLIASIELGGDLKLLKSGSFTLTENRNVHFSNGDNLEDGYSITHNSGKIPKIVTVEGNPRYTNDVDTIIGFRYTSSGNIYFGMLGLQISDHTKSTACSVSFVDSILLTKPSLWNESVVTIGSYYYQAYLNTREYIWRVYG